MRDRYRSGHECSGCRAVNAGNRGSPNSRSERRHLRRRRLSSPARNALACAYRYPAVPRGISCRVSRPRFRSANKLAAIRPSTSCRSLSMSGRILSTKPASELRREPNPRWCACCRRPRPARPLRARIIGLGSSNGILCTRCGSNGRLRPCSRSQLPSSAHRALMSTASSRSRFRSSGGRSGPTLVEILVLPGPSPRHP